MTDRILKSINTKDKLYKILIQTDPEDEHLYTRLKSEFITHRTDYVEILGRQNECIIL